MVRKFTPTRFKQDLSLEEVLHACNQVEDERELRTARLGVPRRWTDAVPIDFGTTFYWTEEQEQQQASNLRPILENR